jgi:hypothetical protein
MGIPVAPNLLSLRSGAGQPRSEVSVPGEGSVGHSAKAGAGAAVPRSGYAPNRRVPLPRRELEKASDPAGLGSFGVRAAQDCSASRRPCRDCPRLDARLGSYPISAAMTTTIPTGDDERFAASRPTRLHTRF